MMKKLGVAMTASVLMAAGAAVYADGFKNIKASLIGYDEVPAVSTTGHGEFRARISKDETQISYELSYADLVGNVLQSHIHLGQPGVNGGIIIFLCSNLGNGPAGTPLCPTPSGTVAGELTASGVIGPAGQGIAPGEFAELIRAMRAGATYVNVHSTTWPGGEIRQQIDAQEGHDE
jgi:hypothetical protein